MNEACVVGNQELESFHFVLLLFGSLPQAPFSASLSKLHCFPEDSLAHFEVVEGTCQLDPAVSHPLSFLSLSPVPSLFPLLCGLIQI